MRDKTGFILGWRDREESRKTPAMHGNSALGKPKQFSRRHETPDAHLRAHQMKLAVVAGEIPRGRWDPK